MHERWKRAVVHLETASDENRPEIEEQRVRGEITFAEYAALLSSGSRKVRRYGTAVFFASEGRRYLITACHVLHDEEQALANMRREEEDAQRWPESMRADLLESASKRERDRIYGLVLRVPRFDDTNNTRRTPFLMNLGAGTSDSTPYTFGTELDLAVVSLDQRNRDFADELIATGHVPIGPTDLADGPEEEGQYVLALGLSVSPVSQVLLPSAEQHWSSSLISLPAFSFGRVSMLHDALPFFWTDLSAYPGHSGGPVVANDRLVGILTHQATTPITENDLTTHVGIPFGCVVKAAHLRELIEKQKAKDERWRRP